MCRNNCSIIRGLGTRYNDQNASKILFLSQVVMSVCDIWRFLQNHSKP